MTAVVAHGPYEHTGAYRQDVVAQVEGTEPQWSDVPVVPAPDLTGMPLPSLRDFAAAIAEQIGDDARTETGYSNTGRALAVAAGMLASDTREVRALEADDDVFTQVLRRDRHYAHQDAWRNLRGIRKVQLHGWDESC